MDRVVKYQVNMVESEAGWGSRIDEKKYFDEDQQAKDFVREYNQQYNNQSTVPDWYLKAEYVGEVIVDAEEADNFYKWSHFSVVRESIEKLRSILQPHAHLSALRPTVMHPTIADMNSYAGQQWCMAVKPEYANLNSFLTFSRLYPVFNTWPPLWPNSTSPTLAVLYSHNEIMSLGEAARSDRHPAYQILAEARDYKRVIHWRNYLVALRPTVSDRVYASSDKVIKRLNETLPGWAAPDFPHIVDAATYMVAIRNVFRFWWRCDVVQGGNRSKAVD